MVRCKEVAGMVAGVFVELKCSSLGVQSASKFGTTYEHKHNSHSE